MKKKHKILKLAIMSFMVLSASLVTSETLAYWSQVQGNQTTTTTTFTTGEWAQAFPYQQGGFYEVGDLVTYNGITYEAKKSGVLREPGVDNGWKSDWGTF